MYRNTTQYPSQSQVDTHTALAAQAEAQRLAWLKRQLSKQRTLSGSYAR
jgi:hypothetical protein